MKNDLKDIKGLFLVDNKEATVEAIKKIKSVIIYTHGQIKQLHEVTRLKMKKTSLLYVRL